MLTAKLSVTYEDDWTSSLASYDVSGEFLASTFRDRRYFGLFALEVAEEDYDNVIETIRDHESTVSVDVIEQYSIGGVDRLSATLLIRSQHFEYTPLQVLLHEGYIPLGGFGELRNGSESFDLLLTDREYLSDAVELLERFGPVKIEYVSSDFQRRTTPSVTEWNKLFDSITPRRRTMLNKALEAGYFDIPRGSTLEEIADDLDIAKTTASQHLRKAERSIMEFFIQYINISAKNTTE
ncbi:helix-turn-helix domain-containing protein [Halorubrum ezzemoulense]|uniref:helix-turn-helix domain-containing protein n=1 Tax=Halorubrum ezzemoulense TaxID=337243 RepID=UPI00232C918E|nr:helix-turn-helix domain-containing protein [Halorubrum ezzemoulense]MDB9235420.1 helix-turn-helix domain-containing protein [Halorubrum ezzemoulense]